MNMETNIDAAHAAIVDQLARGSVLASAVAVVDAAFAEEIAAANARHDDGDETQPPVTPARGVGGSLPRVYPAGPVSDHDTVPMGATVLVRIPGNNQPLRAMVVNRMRRYGVYNLRMPDGGLAMAFGVALAA